MSARSNVRPTKPIKRSPQTGATAAPDKAELRRQFLAAVEKLRALKEPVDFVTEHLDQGSLHKEDWLQYRKSCHEAFCDVWMLAHRSGAHPDVPGVLSAWIKKSEARHGKKIAA